MGRRLGAVLLVQLLTQTEQAVVVGYVPEYRFSGLDWPGVVASTTHLVLFSLEPTPDGDLAGLDRFAGVLKTGSELRQAVERAGKAAPKVLISIGGAGRSQHFAAAAASQKTRKRLAKYVGKIFERYPFLSGVDLDWEAPDSAQEWRDLGRLAKEIRTALSSSAEPAVLSMTYHPRSGAVDAFGAIKGKKSDVSFVDLFDYCHAMAYTQFDADRRHSTSHLDRAAVEEWRSAGLPLGRLTLGVPFFGVGRKTGEAKTYSQILDKEPSLRDRPGTDESKDGVYFINARSMAQKVRFAAEQRLAGVMIWELGQDKAVSSGASMLQTVWDAAHGRGEPGTSWKEAVLTRIHSFNEDHVIGLLASLLGGYFMIRVLIGEHVRDQFQPPPRKGKQAPETAVPAAKAPVDEPTAPVNAEGSDAASAHQKEGDIDEDG